MDTPTDEIQFEAEAKVRLSLTRRDTLWSLTGITLLSEIPLPERPEPQPPPPSGIDDDTFQVFQEFDGPILKQFKGDQGFGSYRYGFDETWAPRTRIDARSSIWHQKHIGRRNTQPADPNQIIVGGNWKSNPREPIAWVGGLWIGETPRGATYDDIKPNGGVGLMVNAPGSVVDGLRLDNVHEDAIKICVGRNAARKPHSMSVVKNCWISGTLGDGIENDHLANLWIDDNLLDRVYVPISLDPGAKYSGDGEERDNTVKITNNLLRTRSAGSEGPVNWFTWVKTKGTSTCPNLEMHNNLFAFEGWAETFPIDNGPPDRWATALSRLRAASGNKILWLADAPFPTASSWPKLPAGFDVLTGRAARDMWEKATQNWIDSHPQVHHAPGDPKSVPENAIPGFYGSGHLTA